MAENRMMNLDKITWSGGEWADGLSLWGFEPLRMFADFMYDMLEGMQFGKDPGDRMNLLVLEMKEKINDVEKSVYRIFKEWKESEKMTNRGGVS